MALDDVRLATRRTPSATPFSWMNCSRIFRSSGQAGGVLVKVTEKKQLPDFEFFRRGGIDVWQAKRRPQEKKLQKTLIWRSKIGGL